MSKKEDKEKPEKLDHEIEESCTGKFTSCRWMIGYMCCAARFSQSAIRQLIGMATVCMTLQRAVEHQVTPKNMEEFIANVSLNASEVVEKEEEDFTWSSEFEGTVLAAFNFGFIASPIIGGYIAGYFGGKRVITFSLIVGSLATILTPVAARADKALLVFMRAVAGLVMGAVDPAIQSLWSKWAPMYEKSQLTTCSYSGLSIAGITTFLVSGYLCTIQLDNGWPFIFYVFGGFSLLLVFPWLYLVYDSPEQHPRIKMEEIKYINHGKSTSIKKSIHPPWPKILTSLPFWAIVVAHVTYTWVTSWVLAYLPKYLNNILKFSVEEDGIVSSIPFVGRLVSGAVCGYLSDWLQRKRYFTTGTVRKIFQSIGCVGCAGCMIGISFLDHNNRIPAVCLLIMGLTFQNFTSVAFRINHLDIAPRYAGVLMGVTTTVAMSAGLSAPFITSALIEEDTAEEWKEVFWIVAALNVVGAIIFAIFAKGEVQPWAIESTVKVIDPPIDESSETRPDVKSDLPAYIDVISDSGVVNPAFTIKDEDNLNQAHNVSEVYEESSTKL
ncbi:hypothetical protein SNE40_022750 [Patella caerulea]|uniref:Major facilitator superfamily (MFS) profile domain-containing protein n=1 Tax=Patella caerulea TaxID=87958 RepID=A0AAN8GGG9_PATCE